MWYESQKAAACRSGSDSWRYRPPLSLPFLLFFIVLTFYNNPNGLSMPPASEYPDAGGKMFRLSRHDVPARRQNTASIFRHYGLALTVGNGVWVKSFLQIAKRNHWVLLSATPGDNWTDYIPVFLANGFYHNRSEFIREHVIYKPFTRYPQIDRYVGTGKLIRERNDILVTMDFKRETVAHHKDVYVDYDVSAYHDISRRRWNVWGETPIVNASEYCYCLRRVVNGSNKRLEKVLEISKNHPRVIIFYNFDYELEALKGVPYGETVKVAEWNGHKHEPIPKTKKWVYLVQYTAGAEGWNCTETDTVIFYSQNYSYKTMVQASGRIDRLNTPFTDLYYYHLKSRSGIDIAISRALKEKRKFNETTFFARN